LPWTKA